MEIENKIAIIVVAVFSFLVIILMIHGLLAHDQEGKFCKSLGGEWKDPGCFISNGTCMNEINIRSYCSGFGKCEFFVVCGEVEKGK